MNNQLKALFLFCVLQVNEAMTRGYASSWILELDLEIVGFFQDYL
jgi:hypothetical protein